MGSWPTSPLTPNGGSGYPGVDFRHDLGYYTSPEQAEAIRQLIIQRNERRKLEKRTPSRRRRAS